MSTDWTGDNSTAVFGTSTGSGDDDRPTLPSGTVIAQRYTLGPLLGRGGFGGVYRARDGLDGTQVAVKIIERVGREELPRVRRELAAMRLLRIPGVVSLLDEGHDPSHGLFLVTELIEGEPFPAGRRTWDALRLTVYALLETLSRVHAVGIVHRDLKPANVLVTPAGRPVVLDFGLATGPALGRAITMTGAVMGTPAYLSPEQIDGTAIGPPSDLYALGVMIYQALANRLPHDAGDPRGHMVARMALDPTPLRFVAPTVAPSVAAVVDRLLARDQAARPASAAEVLGMLSGEVPRCDDELPWLGSTEPIEQVVAAARAGSAVTVIGLRGSGRTRTLRAAVEVLEAEGREAVWLLPGGRPFESLERVLPPDLEANDLAEMTQRAAETLRTRLAAGTIVAIDDALALDPWSRTIARSITEGALLTTDPEAALPRVTLRPLTEQELRPLFHGPDRLLHLAEDSARELWLRTGGHARAVVDEAMAWLRAGVAERRGLRLACTRTALDRLRAGTPVAAIWRGQKVTQTHEVARTPLIVVPRELHSHHKELLAWVELAQPRADVRRIARAAGQPHWQVEALAEELVAMDRIERADDGRLVLRRDERLSRQWSDVRRRKAHSDLAETLPKGTEERLAHLVTAGALAAIAEEARELAAARLDEGRLGLAAAAIAEGLVAVRASDGPGEDRLLEMVAQVALVRGTIEDLDRALYEIGRASTSTPELTHLEQLVRATVHVSRAVGDHTLREASEVAPFADPKLEVHRQLLLVRAARGCCIEQERLVLEAAAGWARSVGEEWALARYQGWRGLLLYRLGRFEAAARTQLRAAARETSALARIAARINAASALMEADRPREAAELADKARAEGAELRHHRFEGRAEWIARAARYRMAEALEPDCELLEAAMAVGLPDLVALVGLTEGAIAWRAGRREDGARLAAAAAERWRPMGRHAEATLVEALAFACGDRTIEVDELVSRARKTPYPGLAVQALGLVALGAGTVRVAPDELAALVESVPARQRAHRREVLSVDEAVTAIEARA